MCPKKGTAQRRHQKQREEEKGVPTFLLSSHPAHQNSVTMANCLTLSIHISAILLLSLTPFLLFFTTGGGESTDAAAGVQSDAVRYLPVGPIEYRPVVGGGARRVLAPFQLCLLCRCCAVGDPANCSSMPCCFGINCVLPEKPYGVCAFVPKACDCNFCA